jgi:hypothetical protein
MVERAHLLTDVAPIKQLPDHRPQRLGNLVAQLDRQVRDTEVCIKPSWRHKRASWARIETSCTAPAPISLKWDVRFERRIHHQRPEKKERAECRMQQIRVLAEPAEARPARQIALQQRPGVHVRLGGNRISRVPLQACVQFAQLSLDHVVVVVAPGVPGHRSRWLLAAIVEGDDDGVRRPGSHQPAVAPLRRATRQVLHRTGVARVQPLVEVAGRLHRAQRRNPDQVEAERKSMRLRQIGE